MDEAEAKEKIEAENEVEDEAEDRGKIKLRLMTGMAMIKIVKVGMIISPYPKCTFK